MKPASAKDKGRKLQQWVRERILARFSSLDPDDVKSTSMGAGGEDVQLSPAARREFPYSIECKNRSSLAIYSWYQQAKENAGSHEPLLIVKANGKKPLAVVDAAYFITEVNH